MSTSLKVHSPREIERTAGSASNAEMDFDKLLAFSDVLVRTGFLPESIKTAGQCAAIILAGRELGLRPMRALRSLVLVKGKVVESADSQLSRFKTDGGRAQFKTLDATQAVLWLKHPNGDEHTETFTIEDANRAGLTKPDRNGGPSMFLKFPKPMLRSRAITSGLKSIGWEGGAGAYDPDEAAAFAPTRSDDVAVVEVRQAMPLDEAKGFIVPRGNSKGERVDSLTPVQLRAALIWTAENDTLPEFQLALSTVIMDLEGPQAGDVASSDSPVEKDSDLAPTSSGPALPLEPGQSYPGDPYPEDLATMSPGELKAKALNLLMHPSMNDAFIKGTREQLHSGLSVHQLRATVRTLEEMIAKAPPARAKGERRSHTVGSLPGGA